ncbi:MAG: hypothetical protein JW812_03145 [Alphaproteobacteria bacterium]|nr:hypothetical protein [Alphaproteobacteria bacterium]MBN2779761.1 hypothetical protein [Alphaproteobacteria bacterium]
MINLILDFMKEAGVIALSYQENITHQEKADKSLVTEADLKLSQLFTEKMAHLVANGNHTIIDEEDLKDLKTIFEEIDEKEFTWIIDPIDGTKAYFHGMPFWAIAIGVFKNKKPYLGAIYMPGFNELIYTDSEKTYLVNAPFTQKEQKKVLNKKYKKLRSNNMITASLHNFPTAFDTSKISIMDCYGSYAMTYNILANRTVGSFIGRDCKLWDIAASAPIAQNLGLSIFNTQTNKKLINLNDFDITENWKFKDFMLICHEENYNELKKVLK